jgi:hypothetical protein
MKDKLPKAEEYRSNSAKPALAPWFFSPYFRCLSKLVVGPLLSQDSHAQKGPQPGSYLVILLPRARCKYRHQPVPRTMHASIVPLALTVGTRGLMTRYSSCNETPADGTHYLVVDYINDQEISCGLNHPYSTNHNPSSSAGEGKIG